MPHAVQLTIDPADAGAAVSPRLFGTFVEHMGRCVYGGIYDPAHPTADADGFRGDVLALVRELGATVVRYPGGNFVSGYRWEDGIGPVSERPVRLDAAWHSTEPNRIGLHEFAAWATQAGLELIEAVNLGTRGPAEAADLLEYANHPSGTAWSDLRRRNGRDEPFGIRLWCLGNEMDGPWQIGHKTAEEYGRLAAETARLMRFIDPTIELVAAGSSNREMPTFGEWERTVLHHTAGLIDHLSVHAYYQQHGEDAASFLASAIHLDRYLDDVAAIIDEACAAAGVPPVGISVDEWNVWNQTRWNEVDKQHVFSGGWPEAPRLIEDEYTATDALVVGSLLITLIRHADRVSMANLAQLVNVIAPIRAEPDGPAWRQPTFFPFRDAAHHARGSVVLPRIEGGTIETERHGRAPLVDAVATLDGDALTVFAVHRGLDEGAQLRIEIPANASLVSATVLAGPDGDRLATNTAFSEPVAPRPLEVHPETDAGTALSATLPPVSWAVLRLTLAP